MSPKYKLKNCVPLVAFSQIFKEEKGKEREKRDKTMYLLG